MGRALPFVVLPVLLALAPVPGQADYPCPAVPVELLKDDRLEGKLISLVKRASQEIWIATFSFKAGEHPEAPPDKLLRELGLARKRGVKVTVLLEQPESASSDLARENHRSARLLRKERVEVFYDRPDRRSHMKVVVVDGRYVILGSHNLTSSALRHNHELSVLLDSPCAAEQVIRYIKGIIQEAGGVLAP
ncbi:MAG: phospholipase D-like domain-containing protein [Thermodesulfobacteriota bacterium]